MINNSEYSRFVKNVKFDISNNQSMNNDIEKYIEWARVIQKIDVSNTKPLINILDDYNFFTISNVLEPSLDINSTQIFTNVESESYDSFFVVPKVIP